MTRERDEASVQRMVFQVHISRRCLIPLLLLPHLSLSLSLAHSLSSSSLLPLAYMLCVPPSDSYTSSFSVVLALASSLSVHLFPSFPGATVLLAPLRAIRAIRTPLDISIRHLLGAGCSPRVRERNLRARARGINPVKRRSLYQYRLRRFYRTFLRDASNLVPNIPTNFSNRRVTVRKSSESTGERKHVKHVRRFDVSQIYVYVIAQMIISGSSSSSRFYFTLMQSVFQDNLASSILLANFCERVSKKFQLTGQAI